MFFVQFFQGLELFNKEASEKNWHERKDEFGGRQKGTYFIALKSKHALSPITQWSLPEIVSNFCYMIQCCLCIFVILFQSPATTCNFFSFYFLIPAARLPKWFGERPGKKAGDADTPEGEEDVKADEEAEDEDEGEYRMWIEMCTVYDAEYVI